MAEHDVSIEVVASWGGTPLDTTLVGEGGLRVGPGAASWLTLPSEVLGRDHPLVQRGEPGGWILRVPAGAEVALDREGAALGDGEAVFVVDGERRVALERGMRAQVTIAGFSFFVRATEAVSSAVDRRPSSLRWTRWLVVAAVLHAALLGIFAMSPPDASALNLDGSMEQTRYITTSLNGISRTPPPPLPVTPAPDAGGSSSDSAGSQGGGQATAAAEGGSPAPQRSGRRSPRPAFTPSRDDLSTIGALAVLNEQMPSFGDGRSPYTAGSAEPGEGGLANAAALALPGGPGWGELDLGSTGIGTCDPRTQDCTEGMVGVGRLDTHGDPGDGHVPGLRRRSSRVPARIHTPRADTLGALSREQVRRTVRIHINEVRFCYEQGLQQRPDLEGRVAVRFIIAPGGDVQSAAVASNTVGNDRVGSCIEQAVSRWTFPSAPGVTGVTYPFVLQSTR